jgi:peptidyl-prolyl cis-trans isomerase SurA
LYREFIDQSADEFYRNNLELYNPDFAYQVKEFRDANLLFGIMERNVWGKANNDTTGLQQYYNQHKAKYVWPASADAIMITCSNKKLAEEMQQKLKDSVSNWRQITDKENDITADSSRFELGQLPVIDRTNLLTA